MIETRDICDAGSVTFPDGLGILLNRRLDALKPGEVLTGRSADAASTHDLRAWTRLAGHRLFDVRQNDGHVEFRIERGPVQRVISPTRPDWGNRAKTSGGCMDTREL